MEITEAALKRTKFLLDRRRAGLGIRIGVKTTGCSGLAYTLEFADQVMPGDIIHTDEGINILISPEHQPYLQDLLIDYVKEGLQEGFKFTNPLEKSRCGCGESFQV